ncbi:MAG: dynamin family protein, partial [Candidatus Dormibacteria bacterium]
MEPESVNQAAAADGLAERLGELSQLALLPPQHREVLAETAQKLRSTTVYVAVVGDFKRGKSSLINALLGQPILP